MAVSALTGHGHPDVLKVLPATVSPDRVALVGLRSWTYDVIGIVAGTWATVTGSVNTQGANLLRDPCRGSGGHIGGERQLQLVGDA